jgi:class 3 adenylate cyclase
MREALKRHNKHRVKQGPPALRQGIGVHYGPVVAGSIGVTADEFDLLTEGEG